MKGKGIVCGLLVSGLGGVLITSLCGAAEVVSVKSNTPPDLEQLRRFYLRDIHVLRDDRPGKNSFVEAPDRRLGSYKAPGQRLTLLDVAGPGSLRHLWSTWRERQGNHRLNFYVDDASQPTLSSTLDELITRAQQFESPPVPVPGFIGNVNARNYFLPLPFRKHLRLEMETLEPTWLIFYQLDYRTGAKSEDLLPATSAIRTSVVQTKVTLPVGGKRALVTLQGPGILRRWAVKTDLPLTNHAQLDLEISYDNEVVVQLTSFFNVNFNWAGFLLRVMESN